MRIQNIVYKHSHKLWTPSSVPPEGCSSKTVFSIKVLSWKSISFHQGGSHKQPLNNATLIKAISVLVNTSILNYFLRNEAPKIHLLFSVRIQDAEYRCFFLFHFSALVIRCNYKFFTHCPAHKHMCVSEGECVFQ